MKKKVVVIGGNAAGMSAASQVKRLQPEWEAVVLEKSEYFSYASCGMPYYLEGIIPEISNLMEFSSTDAINKRNIDLRRNCEVTEVKPEEKMVFINTPTGPERENFDFLLIAAGTLPLVAGIHIPAEAERIFTLKNINDMKKISNFIEKFKPQRCAVIGGGYIALEMLEAFKTRGMETHLIHRRNDLAQTFEKEISNIIKEKMLAEGLILNLETAVNALEEKDGQVIVRTDKEDLQYDFVLVATGVVPNTDFLKGSSIELGIKDSVKVNRYLQTNYNYIYSAGDCAETVNMITGKNAYVPLAPKANKEGFLAGINICGGKEEYPGILGTAITKLFDLGIGRTGLTLDEAEKNGFNPVKYQLSSNSRAKYYPGSEQMNSIIIASKDSGRILGAQLTGPLDSVKRIDVYSTMIYNKMTVKDAFNLDLAYAPPFSPVYDPVLLAARVGRKHI